MIQQTPNFVQVTVLAANIKKIKGKNGHNSPFVTISLGTENFKTSVIEDTNTPEWNEACDFKIPKKRSNITLNLYHYQKLGIDDFIGQVLIPLSDFENYEESKIHWYPLKSKSGKQEIEGLRGELQAQVAFIVKDEEMSQSMMDLTLAKMAHKGSSIKNLAKSMGSKIKNDLSISELSLKDHSSRSGSSFHLNLKKFKSNKFLKKENEFVSGIDKQIFGENYILSNSLSNASPLGMSSVYGTPTTHQNVSNSISINNENISNYSSELGSVSSVSIGFSDLQPVQENEYPDPTEEYIMNHDQSKKENVLTDNASHANSVIISSPNPFYFNPFVSAADMTPIDSNKFEEEKVIRPTRRRQSQDKSYLNIKSLAGSSNESTTTTSLATKSQTPNIAIVTPSQQQQQREDPFRAPASYLKEKNLNNEKDTTFNEMAISSPALYNKTINQSSSASNFKTMAGGEREEEEEAYQIGTNEVGGAMKNKTRLFAPPPILKNLLNSSQSKMMISPETNHTKRDKNVKKGEADDYGIMSNKVGGVSSSSSTTDLQQLVKKNVVFKSLPKDGNTKKSKKQSSISFTNVPFNYETRSFACQPPSTENSSNKFDAIRDSGGNPFVGEFLKTLNRDELIRIVKDQDNLLKDKATKIIELNSYIDDLMLKILLHAPHILEKNRRLNN